LLGVKNDPHGPRRVNKNSKASQEITVCVAKCIFDAIHKNKKWVIVMIYYQVQSSQMILEWVSQIGTEHLEQTLFVFLFLSLGHLLHILLGFLLWLCSRIFGIATNASILDFVSFWSMWTCAEDARLRINGITMAFFLLRILVR